MVDVSGVTLRCSPFLVGWRHLALEMSAILVAVCAVGRSMQYTEVCIPNAELSFPRFMVPIPIVVLSRRLREGSVSLSNVSLYVGMVSNRLLERRVLDIAGCLPLVAIRVPAVEEWVSSAKERVSRLAVV